MSLIEEIVEDESGTLERAVTVVIPAYNEAAHVAEQVRAVDKGHAGERLGLRDPGRGRRQRGRDRGAGRRRGACECSGAGAIGDTARP
jgi:hypothetical protein